MLSMTNAELEDLLLKAYDMSRAGETSDDWRYYDRASSERVEGQTKLMELSLEAARRGILKDIQKRNPEKALPAYPQNKSLLELLDAQRGWVAKRGFKIDRELVKALEELVAFRRVMHRQELTGEDKARELATYQTERFDEGPGFWPPTADNAFLAGLVRGFQLRGEER